MRAMVPSSFMISQITAGRIEPGKAREIDAGFRMPGAHQHAAFARDQREDVAGRDDVAAPFVGSIAVAMVSARSCAEMPVEMPSRASIDTVKAVRLRDRLRPTIASSRARSARAP